MGDSEADTKIKPAMDATIQIPGYKLEKHVGSGAMASVYLAIQESLERQVALKLMAASLVADPTFCERFLKEGKIIAQLNHPNIVTIYDIGVFQSCYYMAMEYVDGGTLKERIQSGLAVEQAVDILRQMASALGYAHSRGFVHRDVKPANILFREDGAAVLSDFGIAKAFDDGTQMTAAGWTVGTPNYMSPEQALGRPVDARSDLYSLGIVFYEMLTGSKPYQSQDAFATALMHVNNPVPRLQERLVSYQPIIDGLLAKDPKQRFANAAALLKTIAQIPANATARGDIADKETQLIPAVVAPTHSKPSYLIGLLGIALIAVAGVTLYWWPLAKESTSPPANNESAEQPPQQPSPPLDEKIRAQVKTFLDGAKVNFDMGYLIYPYTTNAAYSYCQVLALDKQNATAQKGLSEVADAYGKIPDASVDRDELADSLKLVESCLNNVQNHPGLLALREQLKRQLTQ